ncbi:conserved hypothetical protein [Halorubrum lacusprofundi ATCC 49239]|uniref:Uncharacterized protein n=1 Tax=Halorubrum lacusprofundi (strain ATCC 49239 / DSM 5036 / JCM 8891 / ACAM 34) TaxID=416348 RepID=B9LWD1_HALLT|nr:hypothetical protein [Halorubrum lacusprofundi]ACM58521.1 conserved hypothetical protein [Halorubrum lacusprofundi ATCC 49239]
MPSYSDEELLAEIRRVAEKTDADGAPSLQEFRDRGEIGARTVTKRFGSWNDAVDAAGFEPRAPNQKLPREDLVDELERLRDDRGQIPTADQMDEQGAYAYITYYERFGSWANALEEVFGEVPAREWEHVSDAELIAELQRLAGDDGDRPTTTAVHERGAHAVTTYNDRFGSWRDALTAAGFDPPPPQGVTTEELLAEVRRLHDELGGKPTTTVVRDHGAYSLPTYYSRFDSWGDVLDAAFDTIPDDDPQSHTTDQSTSVTHTDEDLLAEIRRVADVVDADGAPSIPEFNEHSDIADSTIHRRFGSWNEGVAAAGFEPNPYGPAISDDELAAELQRLREEVGHPPTVADMEEQGAYSSATYKNRFDSWTAALVETFEDVSESTLNSRRGDSGTGSDRSNWSKGPHVSDEELLDDLRALADELGRSPTSRDMREHGSHSARTYTRRFGSWADAVDEAGIDLPTETTTDASNQIPTADLIADLQRLGEELDRRPKTTDVSEHGAHGLATYQRRFGSWREALEAAGFDPYADRPSDDDLLADLHRLHEEREKVPSLLDVEDDGAYSGTAYQGRFGSWSAALDAAGFDPDRGPTDDELLAELRRLRDELDKRPSMRDMTEHGAYGCTTYQRRFGSWSEATAAAFDDDTRT